jgi:flagellar hook-length control protein FliK
MTRIQLNELLFAIPAVESTRPLRRSGESASKGFEDHLRELGSSAAADPPDPSNAAPEKQIDDASHRDSSRERASPATTKGSRRNPKPDSDGLQASEDSAAVCQAHAVANQAAPNAETKPTHASIASHRGNEASAAEADTLARRQAGSTVEGGEVEPRAPGESPLRMKRRTAEPKNDLPRAAAGESTETASAAPTAKSKAEPRDALKSSPATNDKPLTAMDAVDRQTATDSNSKQPTEPRSRPARRASAERTIPSASNAESPGGVKQTLPHEAPPPLADVAPQAAIRDVASETVPATEVSADVPAAQLPASPADSPASEPSKTQAISGKPGDPAARAVAASSRRAPAETQASNLSQAERVRFIQRVSRAFQTIGENGGHLRLRLSPPELGSLRLDVTVRDGVLSARLEAETVDARDLLVDNLSQLRERLTDLGIKVERFDVDLMNTSAGDAREGASGFDPGQPRSGGQPRRRETEARPLERGPDVAAPRRPTTSGELDVLI